MKAIIIKKFGDESVMQLEDIDTTEPKENEVRIKVKAVGFNPVDCKIREGMKGQNLPLILGSDCSGIVDTIGKNVKSLKVNDEVYAMSYGTCGCYTEYVCLPEAIVHKKPKNLSFQEASIVPLVSMTAYRATIENNSLKEDDTVFMTAIAGGVGSFAIQFAKLKKVKKIFTIARNEKSKSYIVEKLKIDPDNILIYENKSIDHLKDQLLKMNGNKFFDATFDFVGKDIKKLCLELTGCSSHFTTILPEEDSFKFPVWQGICFLRNMSIHEINVGSEAQNKNFASLDIYKKHLKHISQLLEKKEIVVPDIQVVGSFSLDTIKKAHKLLESSSVKGKLAMTMG